jgi:hypothetical protein
LNAQIHPMGPHHLPFYLAPGSGTDVLMVVMGIFLVAALIWVGTLYLRLHSLPERMAHKSEKLQFEIVAILGLLALFTHIHLFWVAGLLLAMIDIPDFGTPLRSIAGSVEKDRRHHAGYRWRNWAGTQLGSRLSSARHCKEGGEHRKAGERRPCLS